MSLVDGEVVEVILACGTHTSCTSFVSIVFLDIQRDLFPHLLARNVYLSRRDPPYPTMGSESRSRPFQSPVDVLLFTLCFFKREVHRKLSLPFVTQ